MYLACARCSTLKLSTLWRLVVIIATLMDFQLTSYLHDAKCRSLETTHNASDFGSSALGTANAYNDTFLLVDK